MATGAVPCWWWPQPQPAQRLFGVMVVGDQPWLRAWERKKENKAMALDTEQPQILVSAALRVSVAGSSVFCWHQPELQLQNGLTSTSPLCARAPQQKEPDGENCSTQMNHFSAFLNWLGTDLEWFKWPMRNKGCEWGQEQLSPSCWTPRTHLCPASGHSWRHNQLFCDEETQFSPNSHTWGPVFTQQLRDMESRLHVSPPLGKGSWASSAGADAQAEISLISQLRLSLTPRAAKDALNERVRLPWGQ